MRPRSRMLPLWAQEHGSGNWRQILPEPLEGVSPAVTWTSAQEDCGLLGSRLSGKKDVSFEAMMSASPPQQQQETGTPAESIPLLLAHCWSSL